MGKLNSNFDELLQKYADLLTKVGLNVQPNQTIILYANVRQFRLVRLITHSAYILGANEVIVKWRDSILQKDFLLHTTSDRLSTPYEFEKLAAKELMAKKASRLSLLSESPAEFDGIDSKRIQAYQQMMTKVKVPVTKATMNNQISWVVAGAAGPEWAHLVYPNSPVHEATDQLWHAIFKMARVISDDPLSAWQSHITFLSDRADWLNQQGFDQLHYYSDKTDITVGLPQDHIWEAAGATDSAGNFFIPNIPTEEVFTAPDNQRINSTVFSTLPLSSNGQLIKNIRLTFKDGKVINANASTGQSLLRQLIDTDAGSRSLGEVALVPQNSPIAKAQTIFFNTLFDENASDHMALGAAYPFSVKSGTSKSDAELTQLGLNQSDIHVDFMMGSDDMMIDGITKDGKQVPIMKNGNWA